MPEICRHLHDGGDSFELALQALVECNRILILLVYPVQYCHSFYMSSLRKEVKPPQALYLISYQALLLVLCLVLLCILSTVQVLDFSPDKHAYVSSLGVYVTAYIYDAAGSET